MGARTLALYLKMRLKRSFIAIASDAAWGRYQTMPLRGADQRQSARTWSDPDSTPPSPTKEYPPTSPDPAVRAAKAALTWRCRATSTRVLLTNCPVWPRAEGAVLHEIRAQATSRCSARTRSGLVGSRAIPLPKGHSGEPRLPLRVQANTRKRSGTGRRQSCIRRC